MTDRECETTSPHGWTLDTLEEFLSSKIKALAELSSSEARASKEAVAMALQAVKEQSAAAMASAEKAIVKSETAVERRFESVNEFRSTLSDQARNFMSREEYNASAKVLETKLANVTSRLDAIEGRSVGVSNSWGFVVGAIGIVSGLMIGGAAVITLIMRFAH